MRSFHRIALAAAALALATVTCGDEVETAPATGVGGAGAGGGVSCPVELVYDPLAGSLDIFPDDFFTVDDAGPTGVRVHIVPGDNLTLAPEAQGFSLVFDDLSTLDGFGTTSALYLQFTAPLDASTLAPQELSAQSDASVLLVAMPAGAPAELVPYATEVVAEAMGDPRASLIVSPLVPLAPKTRHALVVTSALRAESGCIGASATMRELLTGIADEPQLMRLSPRYNELADALASLGVPVTLADLTGAVVFTTQHTTEDSETVASAIRAAAPPSYVSAGPCTDPGGDFLLCEGSFTADDYRVDGHHIDETDLTPQASYTLLVSSYLPKTGTPPFRTILFGHGLNGDRHQAEGLAELAAPGGYAVVAIDAVKHGEHPDQPTSGLPGASVIEFFGLSLGTNPIDGRKLRDNWRQSTYDKLQLIEMLQPGLDIDGDMTADVSTAELVYLGVSLGGIMAAELLAFTPEVEVALPTVPGARVVDIIKYGQTFEFVITLLAGMATDGQIARFFPLVQSIVDRGDAGAYVGHILGDRLPGFDAASPQLLMQMVLADDTVPNSTNLFFARGLGAPHVGDALLPIGVVPIAPALPVSGNIDAAHTAGVFQYDIVYQGMGPATEPATHGNVARNPVTQVQTLHFIDTYYSGGVSEIVDPYRVLGIKP